MHKLITVLPVIAAVSNAHVIREGIQMETLHNGSKNILINSDIESANTEFYSYDNGPCRHDGMCPIDTVCLIHTGTCESCLAWDKTNLPEKCKDGANKAKEPEVLYECEHEMNCPLGKWCYQYQCQACEELAKQPAIQNAECAIFLASLEASGLSTGIIVIICSCVALPIIFVLICFIRKWENVKTWLKHTFNIGQLPTIPPVSDNGVQQNQEERNVLIKMTVQHGKKNTPPNSEQDGDAPKLALLQDDEENNSTVYGLSEIQMPGTNSDNLLEGSVATNQCPSVIISEVSSTDVSGETISCF
ncbi:uncharacterized protein LOC144349430 [Saccoglossus kowalevskii]